MNAKKLLSTLMSAAMAVTMLAGCFGGGGNKNYSDKAVDAANAAQSTVVFATDAKLSKSLQDALENFTQLDDIKDAMEADENLKSLLTSGWDLDVVAEQGEDAEAAAKAIAEKYILSIVSGKKAEGKIAMVLHDGNGYYYVAVLTYGNGGSGSGGGAGGNRPGPGDDDDDEEENGRVFLKEIKVTPATKTVYAKGEEFDPAGMIVTAFYSDGSTKIITSDCKWECGLWDAKKVFQKTGNAFVVVIYEDTSIGKSWSDSFGIEVTEAKVVKVEAKAVTEPLTYQQGEDFDPDDVEVFVTWTDSDQPKQVSLSDCDYEIVPLYGSDMKDDNGNLLPGKYQVKITYQGVLAENAVEFSVNSVIKIAKVEAKNTKASYFEDDPFDPSTVQITVIMSNGKTETTTLDDAKCDYKIVFEDGTTAGVNENNLTPGKYEVINITYDGVKANKVSFDVSTPAVTNISVTGVKDTYTKGSKIESEDITVTATLKNGKTKTLDPSEYTIEPAEFTEAGEVLVTITYKDDKNVDPWIKTVKVEETTHTVTVEWNEAQGSVKINGTTYKGGTANVDIEAGTKVVVQAVPCAEQGYVFDGFTGTSKDGTVDETAHTYTIDSLSKDVSIGVNFKLTQVTVTLELKGNGSGTVKFNGQEVKNGDFITVNYKQAVTIKAEADSGSKLDSIKDSVGNDVTKVHPSSDITITVKFESVQPEIARIEVTQDKDIYVGQTLTSEYLAVTAYDASGNKIANPGLTFNGTEQLLSEARGTNNPYKATVSYKDGDGNIYTPDGGYVPIVVKNPEITILTDGCEPFATGDTFFYHDEIFRKGMKIQFIYGENKGDPIEIHKNMVGSTILVTHYQTINDEWVDASGFSFDHPRDQNVKLLYVDNNGIFYEFIVRINVKGA